MVSFPLLGLVITAFVSRERSHLASASAALEGTLAKTVSGSPLQLATGLLAWYPSNNLSHKEKKHRTAAPDPPPNTPDAVRHLINNSESLHAATHRKRSETTDPNQVVSSAPLTSRLATRHPSLRSTDGNHASISGMTVSDTLTPSSRIVQAGVALEAVAFLLVSGLCWYQIVVLSKAARLRDCLAFRPYYSALATLSDSAQKGFPRSSRPHFSSENVSNCRNDKNDFSTDYRAPETYWFPISFSGHKARCLFMWLLSFANLIRSLSLICLLFWINTGGAEEQLFLVPHPTKTLQEHPMSSTAAFRPLDDFQPTDVMVWDVYLLHAFPTLFFLATYWVAVLFWAQLYYASNFVVALYLKKLFWIGTVGVVAFFLGCAVVTRILNNFVFFRASSLLLIGFLHILIAVCLFYFGLKVVMQLKMQPHQGTSPMVSTHHNTLVRRVFLLSLVCPLIFVIRGIFCLLFVFSMVPAYHPSGISRLGWDGLIYFVCELIPDVLILFAFWCNGNPSHPPAPAPSVRSPAPFCSALEDSPVLLPSPGSSLHNNLHASLLLSPGLASRESYAKDKYYTNSLGPPFSSSLSPAPL